MFFFDTIILGGGASGSICALQTKNTDIAIIDKYSKLSKKLLVTGNGRCNLTNINCDESFYNDNIIKKFFNTFSNFDTIKFFNSLGLVVFSDKENRVYPLSNSAKSVVDVLNNQLNQKNISKFLDVEINHIEIKNDKFILKNENMEFCCNKLVVASGGNSICGFLNNYNIIYRNFCPSLCAIKTLSTYNLNNIKLHDVKVYACNNKGQKKVSRGEVLFKESGLSGIVIFNLSSIFARNNEYKGKISIDLMPDYKEKDIINLLKERKKLGLSIAYFFDGLFVREIAWEILSRCKIDENRLSNELKDDEIIQMVKIIKNFDFIVKGNYNNNQVFSGGVSLNELDDNLMHKKIKNLYFCGEVCDIDGECGGYNLQWAWTSGSIVGKNL